MARKEKRKNISIRENLSRKIMNTFGLSVMVEGIPYSESFKPSVFLEKFTTDSRAEIGLYHADDLNFIDVYYPNLPKEFLWTVPPQFDNEPFFSRGLYKDLKDSFHENEEIDLSKEFIQLFVKYFTVEENRRWLSTKVSKNEIDETLSKLVEKYEDEIFELIS